MLYSKLLQSHAMNTHSVVILKLTASATAVVTAVAPSCAAKVAFLIILGLMSSR